MIICIPTIEDKGLESGTSQHFGRAPYHYIVNTKTHLKTILAKPEGEHGHCVPVQALIGKGVEVVFCKGIGRGAVNNFSQAGITVLKMTANTLRDALIEYAGQGLDPVTEADLCEGHHDHGG